MLKKSILIRILIPLIFITSACAIPGAPLTQQPGSGQTEATIMPTDVPAATQTSAAPESPYITADGKPLPEPPISGLMDNLETRFEAGEWTYEEGLIASLKYLANQTTEADINPAGKQITSFEGSGVVRAAAAYIQNGSDQATRQELQRLLDLVFPSTQKLELYSVPARQGNKPGAARLAAPDKQDINCATIWTSGFPAGTPTTCFEYRQVTVNGNNYRLFIPVDMPAADGRMLLADAIMLGIPNTVNKFLEFGDMPPADFVFTNLPHTQDTPTSRAEAATWLPAGGNCHIAIFPEFGFRAETPDIAQQVIAHELFHCYQFLNYRPQIMVGGPADWWVEGTAEFFGNVAYPTVNAEYEYTSSFDIRSINRSLVKMDYDNFVFFQYMANQQGAASIIQLISQMPESGGRAEQLAALAGYPGMDTLFHEFGKAYLDSDILDTGGGYIPVSPGYVMPLTRIAETGDYEVQVRDFVLERKLIEFPEDTYHQLRENYDDSIQTEARPSTGYQTWAKMPESLRGCDTRRMAWMATSTRGDGGEQNYTLSAEVEKEDIECDRCLAGRWRLDNGSLWTAFEFTLAGASEQLRPTLQSFNGEAIVEFTPSGRGTVTYTDFVINYTQNMAVGALNASADATLEIQDLGEFSWYTIDNNTLVVPLIYTQPVYVYDLIVTYPNGSRGNIPIGQPPIVIPGGGAYQCSASTLMIFASGFNDYIKYDKVR